MVDGSTFHIQRSLTYTDPLLTEIVGGGRIFARDFVGCSFSSERRLGELNGGLYLALRVTVDDDEGKFPARGVASGRDIQNIERAHVSDPVRPGRLFRGQIVLLTVHVGVENDPSHVLRAQPQRMVDRLQERV
jgi:hypothetical protein